MASNEDFRHLVTSDPSADRLSLISSQTRFTVGVFSPTEPRGMLHG